MKTLDEIARYVGGEMRGDGKVLIERVVHPANVESATDLAFLLSNSAIALVDSKKVTNVILPAGIKDVSVPNQIIVERPRLVLARLMELFERPVFIDKGIHPSAVIDPSAVLGKGVEIGPCCWVGPNSTIGSGSRLVANVSVGANVVVGEKALFHAGVRIGDFCRIGDRVILQPNAVIGGDGFAFVTPEPGSVESVRETGTVNNINTSWIRINSIGIVVIEDDVEIGSGTCVDRGTLGETRIGKGSKLDNLIQVGHNVTVGEHCAIVSQVGLGGSSKVGNRAVVGGQAGLPDHLSIGDDAVIHAQAGITGHIAPKMVVIGSPAVPKGEFLEQQVVLRRGSRLNKMVHELKNQLATLQGRVGELENRSAHSGSEEKIPSPGKDGSG